jgi:hypothetical protein
MRQLPTHCCWRDADIELVGMAPDPGGAAHRLGHLQRIAVLTPAAELCVARPKPWLGTNPVAAAVRNSRQVPMRSPHFPLVS